MSKLKQVFIKGTVILLMAVPVLFCLYAVQLQAQSLPGDEIWYTSVRPGKYTQNFISNTSTALNPPQINRSVFKKISDRLSPVRDTLIKADTNMKIDTLGKTKNFRINTFRMKKSPWLAVGFSALLPGAGQLYNESYWKIPIMLGFCGYFGWQIIDNQRQFADYRDRYSASQTPENGFTGSQNLKTLREFYRNQRDDFIWYFTIAYVVNLIDAYIDAHLFDFDVREEKFTQFGKTDIKHTLHIRVKF